MRVARRIETRLTDDVDGSAADKTVRFTLDGTSYEIDLSDSNAEELRSLLDPYIRAGRRLGRAGSRSIPRGRTNAGADKQRNRAIRDWARAQGMRIAERGRIPIEISLRYDNR
jgi:hypothetical protein